MIFRTLGLSFVALLVGNIGCNFHTAVDTPISGAASKIAYANDDQAIKDRELSGTVAIVNLPPHRGLIVSLAFFKVSGADSDPPNDAADAETDVHSVYNNVELNSESIEKSIEIPFSIKHSVGHFYVQVRAILFRKHDGKDLTQFENFLFRQKPLSLLDDLSSVQLAVEWPTVPVEDLGYRGKIFP